MLSNEIAYLSESIKSKNLPKATPMGPDSQAFSAEANDELAYYANLLGLKHDPNDATFTALPRDGKDTILIGPSLTVVGEGKDKKAVIQWGKQTVDFVPPDSSYAKLRLFTEVDGKDVLSIVPSFDLLQPLDGITDENGDDVIERFRVVVRVDREKRVNPIKLNSSFFKGQAIAEYLSGGNNIQRFSDLGNGDYKILETRFMALKNGQEAALLFQVEELGTFWAPRSNFDGLALPAVISILEGAFTVLGADGKIYEGTLNSAKAKLNTLEVGKSYQVTAYRWQDGEYNGQATRSVIITIDGVEYYGNTYIKNRLQKLQPAISPEHPSTLKINAKEPMATGAIIVRCVMTDTAPDKRQDALNALLGLNSQKEVSQPIAPTSEGIPTETIDW